MRTRRHILQSGLGATAFAALPAFAHSDPLLAGFPKIIDAYVGDVRYLRDIGALVTQKQLDTALKSTKIYATISEALLNAPADDSRYSILLGPGTFREKLNISRNNVTLYGGGYEQTLIVYGDYADKSDGNGGTLGTSNSQTVAITGKRVRLIGVTIANDFDYIHYLTLKDNDPNFIKAKQAVALKIAAPADETFIFDVSLIGYQDTLYINSGRSWINYCKISGSVDFIFGAGTAFIDFCQVISRLMPGQGMSQGYIAAPSTLRTTPYGFVFSGCKLVNEWGNFPLQSVALARPWRPTTTFADGRYGNPEAVGSAIFTQCELGGHISYEGFTHMGYNQKDGQRGSVEPRDARFFVHECSGPSADEIAKTYGFPANKVPDLKEETVLGLSGWAK